MNEPATLRLVARVTVASGMIAAVGVGFLLAMAASFAIGADAQARAFGWINDILVLLSYLMAVPAVIVISSLVAPGRSLHQAALSGLGLATLAAVVGLQFLLVVGSLSFEAESGPVSVALLAIGAWFVLAGWLGRSVGVLPLGLRMGLLAAIYLGYPIWAIWVSRQLTKLARSR